jgi:pimeloyl-ACP methyl ester carboxylesterase
MAHAMPQIEGVDHRFIRAGEMDFHVALAGEGDPVLLLHGWPQHWYAWRLVIPRLAERYRVVAMDLRGFGWSDIAWTGFEKEGMADDVARVLSALEIERARVVGHDWGGWIGYLLAFRRPELVRQLVALSSPPPWVRPTPGNLLALARLHHMVSIAAPFLGPKLVSTPRYVRKKVSGWAADGGLIDKDVRRIYARDLQASTRARAATLLHRTFLVRELLPVLAGRYRRQQLEVPTLVMHGSADPVLSSRLFRAPDGAGHVRVEAMDGAGHLLPEERPEEVSGAILEFFEEEAASASREAAPT